jgi:hypothetical protein
MLEGATDYFDKCVGFVFNSLTHEQPRKQEEERWVPIDRPQLRSMSLYQCEAKQLLGVYYSANSVDARSLEIAYHQIGERIPSCGKQLAASLLEPFQQVQTGNTRDALLNHDVINYFFNTLQSRSVAVIESHLFMDGAIEALTSSQRAQLYTKIAEANLIHWPLFLGDHWYLMVIEKFENHVVTINVLDSNNNKVRHGAIANEGRKLLARIYGEGRCRVLNDNYPSYLVPLQDNQIDDGTAIAYYAYKRTQRESLSQYTPYANRFCHYVQFRMHMALEIAQNALFSMLHEATPAPVMTPQYTCGVKARPAVSKARTEGPKRGKLIKVI